MKNILISILILFSYQYVSAQLITLKSKDTLNNKPKQELYLTSWIKLNGIYDVVGLPNTSAMNLPSIPTDGTPNDPHFTMDMYQTRIKLGSTFQTKRLGEIISYIETDFYGNGGGGLRLRHAYIRFNNFKIGQAWSGFSDEEAWPNITDFDGPSTGSWVRQVQLAYFWRVSKNQDIMFSIETPITDYNRYLELINTITPANQNIPDLIVHYEYRWGKGHTQIAGVFRNLKYDNQRNTEYTQAGGFNFSGSQSFFKRDKFIWQLIGGVGISRYLVSFEALGWDGVPNANGNLLANPIYGGYVSYQHFWGSKDISSTFVYGYSAIDNKLNTPASKLFTGSYASGNIYWHIVGPLNLAAEVIYGNRRDELDRFGENVRTQFVFEYNF